MSRNPIRRQDINLPRPLRRPPRPDIAIDSADELQRVEEVVLRCNTQGCDDDEND